MVKQMEATVKLDFSKLSKATEEPEQNIAVQSVYKEVLALLLPLQAREQNEVIRSVSKELETHRKNFIQRTKKELYYMNKHAKTRLPFWKRLFS